MTSLLDDLEKLTNSEGARVTRRKYRTIQENLLQHQIEKAKYCINLLVNKLFKNQCLLFPHREKYKQVDKIQHN